MTQHVSRKDDTDQTPIFEVFLRNITRSLPQYIFLKDQKSVYLGCNENFARLVGLSRPEDIVGNGTDLDLNLATWRSHGRNFSSRRPGYFKRSSHQQSTRDSRFTQW